MMRDFILVEELKKDTLDVAWNRVYVMYKPIIRHYIREYAPTYPFLDDVVQDAFLKNFNKCHDVETLHQLKNRLILTARNLVIDYYRSLQRKNEISTDELTYYENRIVDEDTQRYLMEEVEQAQKIDLELEKQPAKRKQACKLLLEGKKVREVAAIMRIKEDRVYKHRDAFKKVLIKKFGPELTKYKFLCLAGILLLLTAC